MEEVLQALASFFVYAVVAVFAQNAVFTRALGVSRVVKLVDDGTVDTVMYGSLLCAVQLISAPLGYFASGWISQLPYRDYIRPLVFLGCAAVAFFVCCCFLWLSSGWTRPPRGGGAAHGHVQHLSFGHIAHQLCAKF